MRLLAFLFASGLVGVTAAYGQMNGASCPVARPMMNGSNPRGQVAYSLVRMRTQIQTLSNGSQITTRTETREWQDVQGRRRTELRREHNGEMEFQSGSIFDPALRQTIALHPRAKVAEVTRFFVGSPVPQRPVDQEFNKAMQAEYQARSSSRIELKNERLEPSVILGECAEGNRNSQTIPSGEAGNDVEIRSVSESWWSPRLGIQLRSTTDDPRIGHVVDEVTELHLEAPDASVFQPPPDYQVFDLTREPAKP